MKVPRVVPPFARTFIAASLLFSAPAVGRAAEIEFVGVMSGANKTVFAIRLPDTPRPHWVAVGDSVGPFVVLAYDRKAESLTLQKGSERLTLRLPDARIRMGRDEIVEGLGKILNVPAAARLTDFVHPKLRPLFKDEDFILAGFGDILAPGTKVEIAEIPEEFARALASSLDEVEKAIGVRPTHGLWTLPAGKGLSMSFVAKLGDGWFLAPSVPAGTK